MQDLQSSCSAGDSMQDACDVCIVQWDLSDSRAQGFSCGALIGKGAEMKGSTALTSEVQE